MLLSLSFGHRQVLSPYMRVKLGKSHHVLVTLWVGRSSVSHSRGAPLGVLSIPLYLPLE